MASAENTSNISLVAGSGGTTVFRFVELAGALAVIATSGAQPAGVAAETVEEGVVAPIATQVGSKVPVEAGAVLAAGAAVMSNATGQAVAAAGVGLVQAGHLLEASTAAGDIVTMLYAPIRLHA